METWNKRIIGKVHVGELIARGGMSEVYDGEHLTLNRKVAVKIMRDHVDQDVELRSRFEREAQVVANLHHSNIIQIFDYEIINGRPCIIMEFVNGPTLASYMRALQKRGERLPFNMVSRIMSKIASAVDYAHGQNIVHRDIKPSNVLLRAASSPVSLSGPLPFDVEPVLTDFGLVRLLDSSIQTSTGTVTGTPAYMSPEQARGERVSNRTDIYSLGIMLYELLEGRVPFEAESSFGVLMKHLNDPPPPVTSVSPDLQFVIDRALAKDPDLRYEKAQAMVDEFTAIFNGETASFDTMQMVEMSRKLKKPGEANSFLKYLSIAGLASLALTAILYFSLRPSNVNTAYDSNQLGQILFSDFNAQLDRATISTITLPAPEIGTHYDAWFLAEGGEIRQNAGSLNMTDDGQGELEYISPDGENLLSLYDGVEVTIEADNDPEPDVSSGDIVASFVYPPLSLVHVRHLVSSFQGAPNANALVDGLWATADLINISVLDMKSAFNDGDETALRLKLEETINLLVGSKNKSQYLDWNEDGKIDDPGDGYGLLPNGDGAGYIPTTISHAQFASDATDASSIIRLHKDHVIISTQNMQGWSEQLLEKAIQLQGMDFGPEMEPIILEMQFLAQENLLGTDSNKNEQIEPIAGEGGATTARDHAYYMAMMQILPGANQMPPPGEENP